MAIEIKIDGIDKVRDTANRLIAARKTVMGRLVELSNDFGNEAVRRITKDYLSGPRPEKLGVRSGRLRSSIRFRVEPKDGEVSIRVGTDVPYAAIHEVGGKTPPHTIVPKHASVLAFKLGSKTVFARRVNHPGSVIKRRPFLKPGVEDAIPKFKENLAAMLSEVAAGAISGQ